MMNKNIKGMLLFVTLCVLLVGIVCAEDVESCDSNTPTDTKLDNSANTITTPSGVEDNVANDNEKLNKNINDNTVKTATSTEQTYTYIELNPIKATTQGNTVNISGHYYYGNDIPLTYTNMRLNINGQADTSKTDKNGYFTYSYKTTKAGTNTVTVSYPGNSRFQKATATQTFNVKGMGPQDTYIKLNNINDVAYGDYTAISGNYYYGNNIPLTYTNMRININGQTYTSKTDNKGYFTYNYKTDQVGKNTVTVSYPGNTNFKQTNSTKTFNVKITSPIYTYITLNNIKEVNNGQYTSISGYYYYGNNKPLTQTNMRINLNGQTYTSKTDNKGYFTYNYKTTKDGKNTVTVTYPGNTNFKQASNTKTFNVKSTGPQPTYIKLNNIDDISYGDYTYITGYYYYGNDIPLTYTPMTININGEKYTTKTDSDGFFSYYYSPEKVGKNTVNVSYHGNNNFKAASATKTFNVIITSPIPTVIDMFIMGEYELGKYMNIQGYYLYGSGMPLTQTTLTIDVEGQKYYAKTDDKGYFCYKYKPTKSGPNIVTVTYPGNKNFMRASCVNTIIVVDLTPKVVTVKSYSTNYMDGETKIIGSDILYSYYETKTYAQTPPGVWVENRNMDAEVLDDLAPTKRLLSAKFYFRNNNNQIKTKTVNAQYMDHISTSLISGYTPFKVDVTYRDMTEQDRAEWYGQFGS